jgi:hypothetical protein
MNTRSGGRPHELADPRSTSTINCAADAQTVPHSVAAGADRSDTGHGAGGYEGSSSDCNLMEEIITVEPGGSPERRDDRDIQAACPEGGVGDIDD